MYSVVCLYAVIKHIYKFLHKVVCSFAVNKSPACDSASLRTRASSSTSLLTSQFAVPSAKRMKMEKRKKRIPTTAAKEKQQHTTAIQNGTSSFLDVSNKVREFSDDLLLPVTVFVFVDSVNHSLCCEIIKTTTFGDHFVGHKLIRSPTDWIPT